MKTINFNKNGKAISDYEVSNFVDEIFKSNKTEFNISSHLVVDEIRARIKEGKIDLRDVKVYVDDIPFKIDKHGRAPNWPEILCLCENIMMRLL